MTDPTSPRTGEDLLRVLTGGDLTVPGFHPERQDASARLVGAGESYAAWLVEAGDAAVLFRFPRRPPEEMPATMAQELTALESVPEGLGPRGVTMEDSLGNPLGRRYLVTTYVPGEVVDGVAWTPSMVTSHVLQLARLHDATHRSPAQDDGTVGTARDLAAEAAQGYAQWAAAEPSLAAGSSAAGLLQPVLVFLRERRWAFRGALRSGLVHGDAVATNVVFDGAGVPRCIDWEWAHVGDAAQDLAYVGGEVHGGPWYVPMSRAEVEQMTRRYARARQHDRPRDGAFDALLVRREAWEVYERFLSSLHFERVHRSGRDPRYGGWVATLRDTLQRRLS